MRAKRRGFTLVEALTVMAILGVLVALLAPAVQAARESARSMVCKSRLRSLVTAVLQYENTHRMLPMCGYVDDPGFHWDTSPSVQTQILPFLEHSDLFDRINFDIRIASTLAIWDDLSLAFTTVSSINVSAFLCPSDGRTRQLAGCVNYRVSVGNGPMHHRIATFPDSDNGAFPYYAHANRMAHFIDGTAYTAAFSERVVGSSSVESKASVRHAYLQNAIEALGIFTADDQLQVCGTVGPTGAFGVYWSMGSSWLASGQDNTLYAHCSPPNSAIIDCIRAFPTPIGAATARSMHPGKVHVAFLDGSTRAVSDQVNLAVWRALGSRDGQEIVLRSEF